MGIKRFPLMFDVYYYYGLKGILFIMDLLVIYTDDIKMIAHKKKDVKEIINKYKIKFEELNIRINFRKSYFFSNNKYSKGESENYLINLASIRRRKNNY